MRYSTHAESAEHTPIDHLKDNHCTLAACTYAFEQVCNTSRHPEIAWKNSFHSYQLQVREWNHCLGNCRMHMSAVQMMPCKPPVMILSLKGQKRPAVVLDSFHTGFLAAMGLRLPLTSQQTSSAAWI